VTAELVVALPAALFVLTACVWGLGLAAGQVRLQDAAGMAARAAARGDPVAEGVVSRQGDLLCVRIEERAAAVPLVATACALP